MAGALQRSSEVRIIKAVAMQASRVPLQPQAHWVKSPTKAPRHRAPQGCAPSDPQRAACRACPPIWNPLCPTPQKPGAAAPSPSFPTPDAGKTTLTEKLLLFSGAIQIAGAVKGRKASRHATSDWMEIEKQRGISVASSVMQMAYRDHVVNLLDTPATRTSPKTPTACSPPSIRP